MFSSKEILDFVVNSVRAEEKRKKEDEERSKDYMEPVSPHAFWTTVGADTLIEPSKKKAQKHREREQEWTKRLEEAEKELREKGITVDVYDSATQTYMHTNVTPVMSGAISNVGTQQFQPRVDQKLMDNVKNAKNKMMEHRNKAEQYEKYARAFAFGPDREIKLTVEDIHYFGLEK